MSKECGKTTSVQRRQSTDGRLQSQRQAAGTGPMRWRPRRRTLEGVRAGRPTSEGEAATPGVLANHVQREGSSPEDRSPALVPQADGDCMFSETDSDEALQDSESDDGDEGVPCRADGLSWEWPLSRSEKFSRLQTVERMMHCLDRRALKHEVLELREEKRRSRRFSLMSSKGLRCSPEASTSAA